MNTQTKREYQDLIEEFPFEVWDYDYDQPGFARSFASALEMMHRCQCAKITRLADNVVIAETKFNH